MGSRYLHRDHALRLAARAMANGGRKVSLMRYTWDVSGNCSDPVTVILTGKAPPDEGRKTHVVTRTKNHPVEIEMNCPCKKCENCLKRRSAHWRLSAQTEWRASIRTWFATLTINPTSHIRAVSAARVRMRKQGLDYDQLDPRDQFLELHKSHSRHLQNWLKRLRKNSGSALRYLIVTEAHLSGLPHYHALIHERDPLRPLSHDRHLAPSWVLGFSKFKLVKDANAAAYVTKYLSKSALARVRASLHYGSIEPWETLLMHSAESEGLKKREKQTIKRGEQPSEG